MYPRHWNVLLRFLAPWSGIGLFHDVNVVIDGYSVKGGQIVLGFNERVRG